MISINQAGLNQLADRLLHHVLIPAMEEGVLVAQGHAPIDTSSLMEDIRVQDAGIEGGNPVAYLAVGGGDYRGQTMSKTGKTGNLVDYAMIQESKHGFLESGAIAIAAKF